MVERGCQQPRDRDELLNRLAQHFGGRVLRVRGDRILVDGVFVLEEQIEQDFRRAARALEEQLRRRALQDARRAQRPSAQVVRSAWNPRGGLPGEQIDLSGLGPYDKSG